MGIAVYSFITRYIAGSGVFHKARRKRMAFNAAAGFMEYL
jgi:hypothetical protein